MNARQEPTVEFATVRQAVDESGLDEFHIECRLSDGQKGSFIVVDGGFPKLAQRVADLLNGKQG